MVTEVERQAQLQAQRDIQKLSTRKKAGGFGYRPTKRKAAETSLSASSAPTPEIMANNIQLSDGSWISKEDFYSRSEEDQQLLMSLGVSGYNRYYADKEKVFRQTNKQLSDGTWVPMNTYNELSSENKSRLDEMGVENFNKYQEEQLRNLQENYIQLNDESWIDKQSFESLPRDWQNRVRSIGIDDFKSWLPNAYGGATEYIIVDNKVYGTTQSVPNYPYDHQEGVALDASGNRVWVGGRWSDPTTSASMGAGALSPRWASDITTFQPIEIADTEAYYIGAPLELGGTWGLTPETLAVQQSGGNVIKYAGADIEQAKVLTEKAISQLNPVEKYRYEAELQAIESAPGETVKEKLAFRKQERTLEILAKRYTGEYKELGVNIKVIRTDSSKPLIAIELANGELILKDDFDNLSSSHKKALAEGGWEKYNNVVKAEKEEFEKKYIEVGKQLEKAEWISREYYDLLPPKMQNAVMKDGIQAISISHLKPEAQFEMMKQWNLIDNDAQFAGVDETGQVLIKAREADSIVEQPWYNKFLTKEFAKGAIIGMIPIAGTIYHWNTMKTPWEKGLSIALDVACLIPFVGAVSAGVRAGGKLGIAIGRAALQEVKAPLLALTKPIETAKAALYPLETVVRSKKLPLTALELRYSTIRLPVDEIGDAKSAMHARDIITSAAIKGDKTSLQIAGKSIELSKIALQQRIMPAAVHTCPDIRPFLSGSVVQRGREGGLFVSPSLHTRFASASAFGDIPKGGMNGAIIIRDEAVLSKLQPSGKIYRGTAEIEQVIPGGIELPPASQILMTRDVSGNKLHLAIIGKPFSAADIAKMKFAGSVDLIKDIFRPAIKVSGKGIDELSEISRDAKAIRSEIDIARKSRNTSKITQLEKELSELNSRSKSLTRAIDREYAARSSLRAIGLSVEHDFFTDVAYREAARENPESFARALLATSKSERNRILKSLDRALASRIRERISKLPKNERYIAPRQKLGIERAEYVPNRTLVERVSLGRAESKPVRGQSTPRERTVPSVIPITEIFIPVKPSITTGIDLKLPDGKTVFLTPEQHNGMVAWKQGFVYWIRYPDDKRKNVYPESNKICTRQPIEGVKYETGIGSVARSIIKKFGEIPESLHFDLGIQDVEIKRNPEKGIQKPIIDFDLDPRYKKGRSLHPVKKKRIKSESEPSLGGKR